MNSRSAIDRQVLIGLWHLQHGRCAYCSGTMLHADAQCAPEKRPARSTIDHMVPIAAGGRDDVSNRVAACAACNEQKGPLDVATFVAVRLNPVMLKEAVRRTREAARSAHLQQQRNGAKDAGR